MKKKAQERRWKRARVDLWVCPNCGMHAQLYVNREPLPEAYSKEHLMAQVINLIRSGNLSYTRAKLLSREVLAIPRMLATKEEADEVLGRAAAAEEMLVALFGSRPFIITTRSRNPASGDTARSH